MEKYKLTWTPSPSDFADGQKLFLSINGGPPQLVSTTDMSASSFVADLPTGATIDWYVHTVDETGTKEVDSEHDIFSAANMAQLQPATGLGHEWLQHVP